METTFIIKSIPYKKNSSKLSKEELNNFLSETSGWEYFIPLSSPFLLSQECIYKKFVFDNFELAVEFSRDIADLADQENHHPTLIINWGSLLILWTTHAVQGLHVNDISMAKNSDLLFKRFQQRKSQNES